MQLNRRLRLHLLLQNGIFAVLLVALALLLGQLALQHRFQRDLTQNARHALSPASLETLAKLKGPVTVTAYATQQDPRLGDLRRLIREFLAPWQRAKPDLALKFLDPTEHPRLAQAAGIQTNGEMVVEFGGRSEHLARLAEEAFTNLLLRLAREGERLVFYLDGHGERKLDGIANHDLGHFGRQLANKGFRIAALNLAVAQEVPANTRVLVISNPRVNLLEGEVARVLEFVARGGNLLWLIDPEPLRGLQPLAEQLGLTLTPGTVVDPAAQQLSAPATWALGAAYGRHAVTRQFSLVTVFPYARQIVAAEGEDWRVTPLVDAAGRGWVETGAPDKNPTFDKNRDTPGPVTVAVALTRPHRDREQRVVVVGSGNFLANSYLGNGGNLDLGINIMNWLGGDENLIAIQPRPTVDGQLALTRTSALVITVGLLIVLPLAFLAAGGWVWWRRRRA